MRGINLVILALCGHIVGYVAAECIFLSGKKEKFCGILNDLYLCDADDNVDQPA